MKNSIKARLTFFYAASIFIVLSLVAIFLYWTTFNLLYQADYEFLKDEAGTIQYIVNAKTLNRQALEQAVVKTPLEESSSIYRYYIRVYDAEHNVLIETPGAENVLQAQNPLKKNSSRFFWHTANDIHYLLIQMPIYFASPAKQGTVLIALDVTHQHAVIHDSRKIILFLAISALVSLLFGFVIVNRGMRSLSSLTERVQEITATSLSKRIDPALWPNELTGLGNAFNQMLDRIEVSFQRLKQFSGDLSHELRTPIGNLIGQTEVALSGNDSQQMLRQVMESNLEELQRISSLIENILFMTRTENPHLDIKKNQLDMKAEIEKICDYYQSIADEKNIQISCIGEGVVVANHDMFRRMISNLLSNAINYSNNGSIKIVIKNLADGSANIVVSDTGVGIAAEHLPHIFDRFYRVDSARTIPTAGMGLGLAIVKTIIDVHHGEILVRSQVGQGTSISITLP